MWQMKVLQPEVGIFGEHESLQSRHDLTEMVKRKIVKWLKSKTALCDLTRKNHEFLRTPEVDSRQGSDIMRDFYPQLQF